MKSNKPTVRNRICSLPDIPRASAEFETNAQKKLDQSIPPDTLRTIQSQPFACSPLVGC
jgi:hypothetical protein